MLGLKLIRVSKRGYWSRCEAPVALVISQQYTIVNLTPRVYSAIFFVIEMHFTSYNTIDYLST